MGTITTGDNAMHMAQAIAAVAHYCGPLISPQINAIANVIMLEGDRRRSMIRAAKPKISAMKLREEQSRQSICESRATGLVNSHFPGVAVLDITNDPKFPMFRLRHIAEEHPGIELFLP